MNSKVSGNIESKILMEKGLEFYNDLFTFAKTTFSYVIAKDTTLIKGKDAALYF
jgi:hypothetical protein